MAASILEKISAQRRLDVIEAKEKALQYVSILRGRCLVPNHVFQVSLDELKAQIDKANAEFPPIDFLARLRKDSAAGVAVVAEIKRASPSKGDIAPGIIAGEQGLLYAKAGASGISVLTEPTWFKGTLSDMRDVRREVSALEGRPAILRKDFLIDEYQIYEARVYGADTVLLIVAVYFVINDSYLYA
jgi:anthranilate synthase / indole-3-glycerol phosphate synthase / phosphoribosylanthranilate isomerase